MADSYRQLGGSFFDFCKTARPVQKAVLQVPLHGMQGSLLWWQTTMQGRLQMTQMYMMKKHAILLSTC